MLTLSAHLDTSKTALPALIKASNLTERFSEDDLRKIGDFVYDGYTRDLNSRKRWMQRNEAGMDLALQVVTQKSFPWPNCSNVAFPLVTIAAMQFHARAYPSIIQGPDVVKCRVNGQDPAVREKADRISSHMSWQVMEDDSAWEPQHDRELLNLGIVGCNFVKTYNDGLLDHNVSELVLAKDLVVDYWAKSCESAARKTQLIPLQRNDIFSKAKRGVYAKSVLEQAWFKAPPTIGNTQANSQRQQQDNRQGVTPPPSDETTPFSGLEQHVQIDLDGDGYAEPYIITIEETSRTVLRIVTGFDRVEDVERADDGTIIAVSALQYYTKYTFIPAPDGGFYDIGFGVLLGPLNESVNTAINQLFDAGTMATTAGGFLGRGAKLRGGVYTFQPFGWQRVDTTGDDLRKNLVQLEVREPSAVLFQLLSLLINYTNRISGANDMMVGENPGQNTPAETSRAMLEQGEKIYNAIFKRVWWSMKEEFKKLYVLNAIYLPDGATYGATGAAANREDYLGDPNLIAPAADPNLSSKTQRFNQAGAVKASAAQTPGYDPDAVERLFLRSLDLTPDQINEVYVGVEKAPPGKDVKLQIAELKEQSAAMRFEKEQALEAARLSMEYSELQARIAQIQGEIALKQSELEGDKEDREIQRMNTTLGFVKQQAEVSKARLDLLMKQLDASSQARETAAAAAKDALEAAEKVKKLQQGDRKLDIEQQKADKPVKAAA